MKKVLLIGAGNMAFEYAKVLKALGTEITVIGRSESSAAQFFAKAGIQPIQGGLNQFLDSNLLDGYSHAIVTTGIEFLAQVTRQLVEAGMKNILLEKPGGLSLQEVQNLFQDVHAKASIFIAYNRRFYASVLHAQEIIKEDEGILSFNFEFTEWASDIEQIKKAPGVKENWFLANSSHVVDLAFFLGGKPLSMASFTAGKLNWHEPAVFTGAGRTAKSVLFSYQANWQAPGRWGVEILTAKHRLYFRPMEKLFLQKLNSITVEEVTVDYSLETNFKPGLYKQTDAFLNNPAHPSLCSFQEHIDTIPFYEKIISA